MPVLLAVHAMGTRFELVLEGDDDVRLRAAGEEALDEIVRLDAQLSFYRSSSDISWINARASHEAVRVEPRLCALLDRCLALSAATDGAFDVTVAPLMKAWQFVGASGAVPDAAALAVARAQTGFTGLEIHIAARTVRFTRPGMLVDLGSAAKGYAVDRAISRLRENGVTSAMLHGGTSSIHVIGPADVKKSWTIDWRPDPATERRFELRDSALAVSAAHGKAFRLGDRVFGHVMDPRSGFPVSRAGSAVVVGPHSFECDALSTALLVRGAGWLPTLRRQFPGYGGFVA
jgi:thiamine biosynthesis lipoprotein